IALRHHLPALDAAQRHHARDRRAHRAALPLELRAVALREAHLPLGARGDELLLGDHALLAKLLRAMPCGFEARERRLALGERGVTLAVVELREQRAGAHARALVGLERHHLAARARA